ncbi:hypothetical protein scyTo_0004372 [Scyliorhinus torazame]|uniref:Uncharacterized protein n=1 Tax=Scyliorhinus torazame TaxID=75743 RepID=A0A401NQM5_SCYTO|nr:hypothetical protein [Scyliorhinus torazame]
MQEGCNSSQKIPASAVFCFGLFCDLHGKRMVNFLMDPAPLGSRHVPTVFSALSKTSTWPFCKRLLDLRFTPTLKKVALALKYQCVELHVAAIIQTLFSFSRALLVAVQKQGSGIYFMGKYNVIESSRM